MLIVSLGVAAVGGYLIYRLVKMSLTTGRKDGFVMAGLIGLVIALGVTALISGSTHSRQKPAKQTQVAARNISVAPRPTFEASSSDTQAKSRVKAYMDSLPGSMIVIVRGDSSNLIVETDYNFGSGDKATTVDFAKDLIYQIQDANSDCVFKYISVNCMNGRNPVGTIVNYENGSFTTIP